MNLQINHKLKFFLEDKARFKVAYGGRGGGKSHDAAGSILIRGTQQRIFVVCLREFQNTLEESVYRLLCNKIRTFPQLQYFYQIKSNKIVGRNGSEIIFTGLRDAANIKSLEGADIAWVEEAQHISKASLEILIPTIRKAGSEIWFTFNPLNESDPVYHRFVVNKDERAIVVKINYTDNPNAEQELLDEAEACRKYDASRYAHIWLGECDNDSEAAIYYNKWEIADIDVQVIENRHYFNKTRIQYKYGLDYGFTDPCAAVENFSYGGDLYVTNEMYKYNIDHDDIIIELNKSMPQLIEKYAKIYADKSRPDMTARLQKARVHHASHESLAALNIESHHGGKVLDGIDFIRNHRRIYVAPHCQNFIHELKNYKKKTDPLTGLPMAVGKRAENFIEDANNHAMDAWRYSWDAEIQALRNQVQTSNKSLKIWNQLLNQNNSRVVM